MAKSLRPPPPDPEFPDTPLADLAGEVAAQLERLKWFCWHGNVFRALQTIDDILVDLNISEPSPEQARLLRAVREFDSYIRANAGRIPQLTRSENECTTGGAAMGMPGLPEVWQWEEQLVGFGTRYTGSSGHVAYVDWLAGQLSAIPGFSMQTDRLTFNRWLARDFALTVSVPATVGRSGPVPLTYYYPYSGQTPADGVTGDLIDLGDYPPANGYTAAFWAPARGGIALVRAAPSLFSLDAGQTATGGYEPGETSTQAAADYTAYAAALTHPAWQGIFDPVPLLDARNAGVLGVVVTWTGLPDDEVINQYNPFTTGYPAASGLPTPGDPGCPAVWVGDSTGTELSALAASGQASATLVLTADITVGAATETVWGWLKGAGNTGKNIIINTHTDGPNATEENGGLGLIALARHLAGLPSRQNDMYFALVTGHFQLPQFTRTIPESRLRSATTPPASGCSITRTSTRPPPSA